MCLKGAESSRCSGTAYIPASALNLFRRCALRPNQILNGEVCPLELCMSDLELGRAHRDSHRERTIFSGTDHSGSLPDQSQRACGPNGSKSSRTTAGGAEYQHWFFSFQAANANPNIVRSGSPVSRNRRFITHEVRERDRMGFWMTLLRSQAEGLICCASTRARADRPQWVSWELISGLPSETGEEIVREAYWPTRRRAPVVSGETRQSKALRVT